MSTTRVKAADGSPYGGTAISIPGTVQAENYNTGGEGVAYHDTDSTNQGGQYRSDGVDIETTSDSGGGYDVGWVAQDEWLKYTVNVTTTGTYNLDFRVASNQAGAGLHLEVDVNNNVTGHLAVPSTGGWQTWTDVTFNNVSISAGTHVLRLYADNAGFNINWFSITSAGVPNPTNTPTPGAYGGTPASIPGTVQAENYNTGGEGVAYHDTDSVNQGGQYRSDGVDIEATSDAGGGYDVGWTASDEWMKYTVNVTSGGTYNIFFEVASNNSGSGLHLEIDGNNVTNDLPISPTGGWQSWTTISKCSVSFSSGSHVLRLYVDNGGFNINWFKISSDSCSSSSGFPVSEAQFNSWFPNRNSLYTYANLLTAQQTYSGFANSGNPTNDAIEAAAFFAHVAHETSSLVYVDEQNPPPGHYEACGVYACPAGQDHHGRGPLQISWNYNYSMASNGMYYNSSGQWESRMTPSVGADILDNANLVSTDGVITWKTALWYWMNHGKDWDPQKTTPHQDISAGGAGFGATINDMNGGIECYPYQPGGQPEMQDRVNFYNTFLGNLGVSDSRNKTC